MKKAILFSAMALFYAVSAYGAVPWWMRPTVCRVDPTNCYNYNNIQTKYAGFDIGMWDATGNCWGMKKICPDALIGTPGGDPVPVGRADIAAGHKINSDFDVNMLNKEEDCYGVRRTSVSGAQAVVDGKYVNVWWPGALPEYDALVAGCEVTYRTQPTCVELARNGWIGILNGKCYGKHYDTNDFFIECGESGLMPERIIVLNKAENTELNAKVPTDAAAADKIFDQMYSVSQSQHKKYFGE